MSYNAQPELIPNLTLTGNWLYLQQQSFTLEIIVIVFIYCLVFKKKNNWDYGLLINIIES